MWFSVATLGILIVLIGLNLARRRHIGRCHMSDMIREWDEGPAAVRPTDWHTYRKWPIKPMPSGR